jgi:phosphate transport system protein
MRLYMSRHFQREIERLKKNILALGAVIEDRVGMAIKAIQNHDAELAAQVIDLDREVDSKEVEIEEECLKILALYQPVAIDLRFIVTVIKINIELERIGDQTVNIAERIVNIARRNAVEAGFDYSIMAEKTRAMLKMSLDSLVNWNLELAVKVCSLDDEVDEIKRQIYDKVKEAIKEHPQNVGYLINLLLISRHLERIADHATNIAQDVIYLIEGKIHRHRFS